MSSSNPFAEPSSKGPSGPSGAQSKRRELKYGTPPKSTLALFYRLFRVILKTNDPAQFMTGGRKKTFGLDPNSHAYAIMRRVLFGVLYLFMMVYFAAFALPLAYAASDYASFALGAAKIAIAITVFSGIYYSATMLFFAKDLPSYLCLPISPGMLVASRLATFFYTMLSTAVIFVPAVIVGGVVKGVGIGTLVLACLNLLFSIVPPICLIVLLTFLLLRYTPLGRSKDRFMSAYGVLSMLVVFGVLVLVYASGIWSYDSNDNFTQVMATSNLSSMFGSNSSVFTVVMYALSPVLFFAGKCLSATSAGATFLWGVGGIASALVYLALLIAFASRAYLPAALMIQSGSGSSGKKLSAQDVKAQMRRSGLLKALLTNDLRRVVRSPFMLQQYVLGPILGPLFMIVPFYFVLKKLIEEEHLGFTIMTIGQQLATPEIAPYALALGICVSIATGLFFGAFGGYSMSPITLEGTDFLHLKTFPVNYRVYLLSKLLLGCALATLLPALLFAAIGLIVKVPAYLVALYFVGYCVGSFITTMFNTFFDTVSPKLDWENEAQLKNRVMRVYFCLLINMVMSALVIVPAILIAVFLPDLLLLSLAYSLIVTALLAGVGIGLLFGLGPLRLQKIEL